MACKIEDVGSGLRIVGKKEEEVKKKDKESNKSKKRVLKQI